MKTVGNAPRASRAGRALAADDDEVHRADEEQAGDDVVSARRLLEPDKREDNEDDEGEDLLQDLQLVGAEAGVTGAVGGLLQAVLKEREPTTRGSPTTARRP